MKCPRCGHRAFVFTRRAGHYSSASSIDESLDQTRRERECKACGHKWTTVEVHLAELQTLRAAAFRDNLRGVTSS
jgi:transcriptional regulator NrdR family protein